MKDIERIVLEYLDMKAYPKGAVISGYMKPLIEAIEEYVIKARIDEQKYYAQEANLKRIEELKKELL